MRGRAGCRACSGPTGGTGNSCAISYPRWPRAWIPDSQRDLIGPGIAIDETAQLKKGEATACVAPQHAGCTGTVENCVTTVFSAYVTAHGQAWVDFEVYLPQRWAPGCCPAAGPPESPTSCRSPRSRSWP